MDFMKTISRGTKVGEPQWCLKTEYGQVFGPFEKNNEGYHQLVKAFNKFPTCLVDIHECWPASKGRYIVPKQRLCDITSLICSRIFAKIEPYRKRRRRTNNHICNMRREDGSGWDPIIFE